VIDVTGYADLHLHTTASDGRQTIPELVRRAKSLSFSAIAITDHDTLSPDLSLPVERIWGVEVITGIEIKADFDGVRGEILAYFVDPSSERLRRFLARMEGARQRRMAMMIERCREETGVPIRVDDVRALAERSIGRPHLARILVEKGIVKSVNEAFADLIGDGRPCYVPIEKASFREVAETIHSAGGVASLAHPGLMKVDDWETFLDTIKDGGVDAIEAFYPYGLAGIRPTVEPRILVTMADERGFLLTGGSDDHGPGSGRGRLGSIRLPYERVEALKEALPKGAR